MPTATTPPGWPTTRSTSCCVDRDPIAGPALASQPTLSRFENAVSWWELRDLAHVLADTVIDTHRRRLKGRATRITIDLDPTDDPTHGQQEFSFFNGHYDTWCYLPVVATVTFNDEAEQFAVAAVLRPGNAPATRGARGILRRLLGKLRAAFPPAPVRVRLDGGFAHPKLFTFLEQQQVEYVVAMASNARLEKRARRLLGKARMRSKATGQTEHLYGETRYAARKWTRQRRVIIKAEVVRHPGRAPKNNPRFVVTNLPDAPEAVYHFYCGRGDVENRLKELHHGLAMDRTSCSRFLANQFRVLLTLGAYILFQELGRRAARTTCADAQVTTLRERLDQTRGLGLPLGAPHCPALARLVPLAAHLAAARARGRRHLLNRRPQPGDRRAPGGVSLRRQRRPCCSGTQAPSAVYVLALRPAFVSIPPERASTTRLQPSDRSKRAFMNEAG